MKINRQQAVIFNNEISITFFVPYKKRIELTKEDILYSERILNEKLSWFKKGKYIRQYLGFENENKEKIVFINLIYLKAKRKYFWTWNKYIRNWKKDLIIGLGDFYEYSTTFRYVNLVKEEIE